MSLGFTRQETLDEMRYERLKETVDEYLSDEGSDPQVLIRDVKRACAELKEYFEGRVAAYNTVEEQIDV